MPASAFAKWGLGSQGPKPYTNLSKYTKSPYDKPYGNSLNSVISHAY